MSERFPDVDWWCDNCDKQLNIQNNFDDYKFVWKCTECGYKNSISKDNVFDEDDEPKGFFKNLFK
ncbi:Sec23/Sec24 zinc finger-containing protein [Enterococcus ureilyticus]|uniref:Sec23/Sec24 zinc finger-containing protein n=1 Tax=Enterococcus ureilyticus TaxID=1131292 RepID=A0A1E5HC16_9ENTE|nr:Sec23/Sec24 zinc finger-containing protein [Enterococcus ureilyticus]MBM7690509.1 hydrogenase maturation factor HypF (carbamoyltransferase family) [Enterococcus ureilyticus]OEG22366.1 Sec23/Sec24 zinc finger-containing protein [Enterococcus ureilyticus]